MNKQAKLLYAILTVGVVLSILLSIIIITDTRDRFNKVNERVDVVQSLSGLNGEDGKDGVDGEDGADGTIISVNSDGELLVDGEGTGWYLVPEYDTQEQTVIIVK